jgi:hypothetical protein
MERRPETEYFAGFELDPFFFDGPTLNLSYLLGKRPPVRGRKGMGDAYIYQQQRGTLVELYKWDEECREWKRLNT